MAQLIDRDDLTQSIINREAKIPNVLKYRDFKAWLDGYTACQHDILDLVRDAPAVVRMSDGLKQSRYGKQEVSGDA